MTVMTRTGWTCTTVPQCTRHEVVVAGLNYPSITVTVSVAANATSPQLNSVSVSTTQLERKYGNHTSIESTVMAAPALTITKTHGAASFTPGSTGNNYTVFVLNTTPGA